MKNLLKNKKGITLIALIITVIIMLILAGVAISVVVDSEGLFGKVRRAETEYENAAKNEADQIQSLIDEIDKYLVGTPINPDGDNDPEDTTAPEVVVTVAEQGMVPVVYNETDTSWYIATEEQIENNTWYDYVDTSESGKASTSKWANVMLMDNLKVDNNGTSTQVTNENLSELYGKKVTSEGSMYVWIPRYAYQITSNLHNGGEGIVGDIDVVFIDTNNKNGDKTYSTTYPTTTDIGTATGRMNDYVVHPAFSWAKEDGTPVEIEGIWIGKFEASAADASFAAITGTNTLTTSSVILRTVGNVDSWRNINNNNLYLNCYNMNVNDETASIYGISTNKDQIDPHLIKNSEWGAAAYLAHSKYGRNKIADETMTNATGYTTGNGNYKANVVLSTTNNVYGIYDMAGGSWERIAAFVDSTKGGIIINDLLNGENSVNYGKALYDAAPKYKDVYVAATTDTTANNYNANAHIYGDGVYETSFRHSNATDPVGSSWNGDRSNFPNLQAPFFIRGGYNQSNVSYSGVFAFGMIEGIAGNGSSFRSALVTM